MKEYFDFMLSVLTVSAFLTSFLIYWSTPFIGVNERALRLTYSSYMMQMAIFLSLLKIYSKL